MKTIRAFDENQNPVTVTLIGDRHLIVNGKEITNTADLSRDDQRQANNACDDLYDCPIFDGKRIITTSMPNCVTAYAWQLAERVEAKDSKEDRAMKYLQFEAAPEGNILHTIDNTIRATVPVPEGASEDYGYLAMKNAILAAYHGTEPLAFWYDGQEQYLEADAADGEPIVEIETTYGEYFAEHDDENLSWCKPYITGKHAIIVNNGEVDYIAIDGVPQEVTPDAIRTLAKTVNDDYDSYQGWSDLHIALDAMQEVGCASCPCFAECEAMREIINQ